MALSNFFGKRANWLNAARQKWDEDKELQGMRERGQTGRQKMRNRAQIDRTKLMEESSTMRKRMGELGQTKRTRMTNQTSRDVAQIGQRGEGGFSPNQMANLKKDAYKMAAEQYDNMVFDGNPPRYNGTNEVIPRGEYVNINAPKMVGQWTAGIGQRGGGGQRLPDPRSYGQQQGGGGGQQGGRQQDGYNYSSRITDSGSQIIELNDRPAKQRGGGNGGIATVPIKTRRTSKPGEQSTKQVVSPKDVSRKENEGKTERPTGGQEKKNRSELLGEGKGALGSGKGSLVDITGQSANLVRNYLKDRVDLYKKGWMDIGRAGEQGIRNLGKFATMPNVGKRTVNFLKEAGAAWNDISSRNMPDQSGQPADVKTIAGDIAKQTGIKQEEAEQAVTEALQKNPNMTMDQLMELILANLKR